MLNDIELQLRIRYFMNYIEKIIDKNESNCILHWKYLNNKYKQQLRLKLAKFVESDDVTIRFYDPIVKAAFDLK